LPFDVEPRQHRLSALREIGQESAQFSVESGGVRNCQVKANAPISTLDSEHDVTRIDHGRFEEVRRDSHVEQGTIDSIETGNDRWDTVRSVFIVNSSIRIK